VVVGPVLLQAELRILSVGSGAAAAAGLIESAAPRARAVSVADWSPGAPVEFSRVAGRELSEGDRVVSADEALSRVGALSAALSVWAGALSRDEGAVLSPGWAWPNAVPGRVKPNKHSAIRRWCAAMRPESIGGWQPSLQVYSG
jgi:hypothetical protein